MATTKAFIHAQWNKYSKDFSYVAYAGDMTEYGYILLEERELSFESPDDKRLRSLAAQSLRAKKNKELAEAHVKAQEIDQEIEELLALEFKPAVEEPKKVEEDDDLPF